MDYPDLLDPSAAHELEQFDFDDLPPPGDQEDEYDAINEETFGADVPFFDEEDLEDIANQTAHLEMGEPSCSVSAPDASMLPIPSSTPQLKFADDGSQSWGGGFWGSGFNGIQTLTQELSGATAPQQQYHHFTSEATPSILSGAKTLDEIEASLRAATGGSILSPWPTVADRQHKTPEPAPSRTPMMPPPATTTTTGAGGVPMTLEELERKLLLDAVATQPPPTMRPPGQPPGAVPSPGPLPPGFPLELLQQRPPPGAAPFVPPHILQMQMQMALGMLNGNAQRMPPMPFAVPPNMPPFLPPFAVPPPPTTQAAQGRNRNYRFVPLNQLPPQPPSAGGRPLPYPGIHAQCWTSPASGNNVTNLSASFSGSTTSLNSRASRGKNLPSCRTISDYAFDPYAGFMSKKEREWLIKIQIIQCMRTGDPIDDDYYYTQWKKRNVLQKAPETWQKKIKPRYYNFEDTYPSAGYTPPSFTGSLGKPTHSSTSMPRQILDFHADVDDEESTVGRVNTQKKLRALLLRIENASLVLLECEEIRRKMDSLPDEERAAAAQKIEERMAMVQAGVFHKDQLPTVMLIQKGRAFVGQYLLAARGPHRSAALRLVFETLPRYAKKAADDQPNTTLTSAISRAFTELPSEDIGALLDGVPFDQLAAIFPVAPLAQELCVALVIGVSKNPWGTVRPALQKWLRSPSAAANAAVLLTFPRDDLDLMRTWLSSTMLSPGSGSLAEKLVSAVGALSG